MDALRLDRVDPEEFVRLHAEAKVNRLFLFFKDHWGYAFYDTKIGIRHPHLKRDFCAEVIEQARKHNISINAYYSIGFDHAIVEKHPDWSIVDVQGKRVSLQHTGDFSLFNMPCYNSPYRRYVLDQLDEIAEGYEFHQMTIDILGRMTAPLDYSGTHACYSEHCLRAYRKAFGRDLPREADWSEEWKNQVDWRLDYVMEFYQEMTDVLQARKPGLPVTRNHAPIRTWQNSWTHAERARLIRGEELVQTEDGGPNTGRVGHMCVLSRALTDRRVGSFELAYQYPVSDAISPTRFKQECMTIFAHGGASFAIAMAGSVYTNGTLEKHSFEMLEPVYRELAEKEGLLLGSVSVPYAGVVFSDATRLFYGRENNHARYGASIEGATRVLLDLHLPFDVIMEWNLTPEYLKGFDMLILPNTAALSKEQAEVLRTYVEEGGRILATFETGLYDERANRLENFQLADLFGLDFVARSDEREGVESFLPSSYLTSRDAGLFTDLPDTELQLQGPFIQTKASSGDTMATHQIPAELSFRGRTVSWGTFPGDPTRYPAVHFNSYGKGRVACITSQVFGQCSPFPLPGFFSVYIPPHGLWWTRRLIGNILRWLDPSPPLRVEAPPTIEATFFRHDEKNQIVVQLINRTNWDVVAPVQASEIQVDMDRFPIREAYLAWPERKPLKVDVSGKTARVTVPEIELHEIVIIQL